MSATTSTLTASRKVAGTFASDDEALRVAWEQEDHVREMEVGVRCVAVGMPGAAPMAMSVSGPAARMTDELVAVAVSALQAASSELYWQLA